MLCLTYEHNTKIERYLKNFLHCRPDVVPGFNPHHLSCGQDPVNHLPVFYVMVCYGYVMRVCPLLCPQVSCYGMVMALK